MNNNPPKYAEKILRFFIPKKDREFLLGDYEYLYQEIFSKRGNIVASIWYWLIVIKAIPLFVKHKIYWGSVMLKSYTKIAIRNLLKRKGYSIINIFGLATGIACAILILGFVQDELSYDQFHENADDLYVATFDNGSTTTPTALAQYLKSEYPEVIKTTRFLRVGRNLLRSEKVKAFQTGGVIVDPDFLKMFSINLIHGDIEHVFDNPYSVLLSETVAEKYFGKENPVGKIIEYENQYEFTVTGIFHDYPENSHIECTFIVPTKLLEELGRDMNTWAVNNIRTYVQLKSNSSAASLNEMISDVVEKRRAQDKRVLFLQPVTDLRLNPYKDEHGGGTITYVYMFSLLALLVLVIACINFVNLTTAKSVIRAKEVGIRKTIGAYKKQLVSQFLGESFILTFVSLLVGLCLVFLLIPYFNELTSKNFTIEFMLRSSVIWGIFMILVFTGLIAGSYPAFFLANFNPVSVLSNRSGGKSKSKFRRISVITQFAASVFLIMFSLIVFGQVKFLQEKDVGFEKENVVYFGIGDKFKQNINTIKTQFLANPNIKSITLTDNPPYRWTSNAGAGDVNWEGKSNQEVKMVAISTDHDYLKTFGLNMVQGRFFSKEFSTDPDDAIVINETAARAMELENPVGKWLQIWDYKKKIIGVVKDYHFESLREEIIPMAMFINPDWKTNACIKISGTQAASTLNFIQEKWSEIYPEYPFEYNFLDETLRRHYETEAAIGKGVSFLTVLALIIACLGLFSLSAYTVEQKRKEIGIRKVLGASIPNIINKFVKEFFSLIIMANIVAWPVVYFFGEGWLQDFPFRIDISIWLFVLTLGFGLILVIAVIGWQIVKAARVNPVESLNYE